MRPLQASSSLVFNPYEAKSPQEGKRHKLETSEGAESIISIEEINAGAEILSSQFDDHYRSIDSRRSANVHPAAGTFPSPANLSSRSALPLPSLMSNIPPPTGSPMSTSPSSPSCIRGSSVGLSRTSTEVHQDRTSSFVKGQQTLPRIVPNVHSSPSMSSTSITPVDSRLQARRNSHGSGNAMPPFVHEASDSSNPSLASTWSSASTAASSLYAHRGSEDDAMPPIVLPPLSTVAGLAGGTASLADHSLRSSQRPSIGSGSISYGSQHSQSVYASSSGTDIDSFVLPLPHKIAFGQIPEPWPEDSAKLANIFDIQDTTGERYPSSNFPSTVEGRSDVPDPTRPSLERLPGIRQLSSGTTRPDPLSVLADAAHANHDLHAPSKSAHS